MLFSGSATLGANVAGADADSSAPNFRDATRGTSGHLWWSKSQCSQC